MSLICSFDATKNKHIFYRERDCIEKFCKDLKELSTEIINYEEQEMIPLTGEENKSYKLSDLIDNLSGINNKEYKSCMERKKIKSRCEFVRFE